MKILFVILLFVPFAVNAQDMRRVKATIDTLCSPGMHGRGYVNNGDKIAAAYLAAQFKSMGLSMPIGSSVVGYEQKFQLPINTFPKQAALQIGKKILVPGVDFIADAASGSGYGKAKWLWLDSLIFSNETALKKFSEHTYTRNVLVYDAKYQKDIDQLPKSAIKAFVSAAAVLVLHDKLTAGVSREQLLFPKFLVKKSSLKKIKNKQKVTFQLDATLQRYYKTQNVIGVLPGKVYQDSAIVVCAHYDHLGSLGEKVYFPGANDNASGIAMLLELAHYFSNNPIDYTVYFIAFGAEEAGLVGSYFYNANPVFPLRKIKFVANIDLFGTGEDGMMAVNAESQKKYYNMLEIINNENQYLSAIKKRGQAANSDHYFFSRNGVPAMFFYLMGDWPNYHNIYDNAPLPLAAFAPAFNLLKDFISHLSE